MRVSAEKSNPDLSVIVVTWNNENYIEQCLISCIPQKPYTNLEVIVVYNASDDKTLEVLKRVTIRHPNIFKVIENNKNEGLGEGRNIGINESKGKFITFLDGDDYYYPGAVDHMTWHSKYDQPDILILDFKKFWPTGASTQNPNSHLIGDMRDASSVAERNRLMPNIGVAWNKVYKKSFIDRIGLKFTKRYYEDIDWHFTCIFKAKTLMVSPRVCVAYRQRSGSITRSTSDRHFDIFDQYNDVFELLRSDEFLMKSYGWTAYKYARGQILNVLHSGDRLRKCDEKRYAKMAYQFLNNWRSSLSGSMRDRRLMLLGSSPLPFYKLANYASKRYPSLNGGIKSAMKKFIDKSQRRINYIIYKHVFLRMPIDNNMYLFESYWGRKYDCNPAAIAEKLTSQDSRVYFSLENPESVNSSDGIIKAKRHSLRYYYAAARSKYLTSNVNFADNIIKRNNAIFVQTFHGTPIKHMGIDIRKTRPREFHWGNFSKKFQKWDFGISSNEHSSQVWRRSHPANYKILESGYPRNDRLFDADYRRKSARNLNLPENKKIALYAPTFRDSTEGAKEFSKSIQSVVSLISNALGDEWHVLVRLHHFNKGGKVTGTNVTDVSDYHSITEILSASDLLVSDYSSLIFDYACVGRPIVLFTPDYQSYNENRGVYFDIREVAPGYVCNSSEELQKVLMLKRFNGAESIERLKLFREKFCPWDDGAASERVISKIYRS